MGPQQLQMVVLNGVIYGGGASSGIFEFPTKKLIFITHIKPKHSEKNEIFSIFSNFGGQDWGLRAVSYTHLTLPTILLV